MGVEITAILQIDRVYAALQLDRFRQSLLNITVTAAAATVRSPFILNPVTVKSLLCAVMFLPNSGPSPSCRAIMAELAPRLLSSGSVPAQPL
ncbi:MAG: hypothetical protein WB630_04535 [Candidatus Acidiferrales bacterium]